MVCEATIDAEFGASIAATEGSKLGSILRDPTRAQWANRERYFLVTAALASAAPAATATASAALQTAPATLPTLSVQSGQSSWS